MKIITLSSWSESDSNCNSITYQPSKRLKETDEIIISHGPSLSASINHAIIPALECLDIQKNGSTDTNSGMFCNPLNYSAFISIIML